MVTKIGKQVQDFYNETPFPDYELDRFNSKADLASGAYTFAKILDRTIPKNATVIDVGTGTGQLSSFLSLNRKNVWGIDLSDGSLSKARKLKEKLKLDSLTLKKVDILNDKEIEDIGMKFDYVLCLGVLHHTGDAYKGFKNILKLLKPGGHIAIGLYNKYGRIPLKIRKMLAKTIFKNNDKVKDWFIQMQIGDVKDKERARGWWNDQYLHPHETSHTIGEVLKWFKNNNVKYYQTVPSSTPLYQGALEMAGVWNNANETYPIFPTRFYKQFTWIWRTHHEGGYWITFGRKNA
ncbi:methyltransferase domain-containing protein [Candidatus Pacearchaeota archaeon]|nr:methyltransferase domain-containing protein [Candidatus Pacearchaeota archaeon]